MGLWLTRDKEKVLVGRASVPAIMGGQGRPPHQFRNKRHHNQNFSGQFLIGLWRTCKT
jgi:hypothetical protein